jgi:uncharacterized circularly permuted ATP-grasp superfamily protein
MDAQLLSNQMPELKASVEANLPMNEMFELDGRPRPECARVVNYLLSMDARRLTELGERAHEMFLRMGVTFNVYGNEDGSERIFPFDPVPRIIKAEVWAGIEAGLIQGCARSTPSWRTFTAKARFSKTAWCRAT